jgi:Aldehyde dehydrogenase family
VPSGSDPTAAWAHVVPDRSGWQRHGETRDGAVAGVRLAATGQASAWSRLPSDGMGSLLDSADLTTRISELLSLAGAFLPTGDSHLGLAVGLSPLLMVSEGPISRLGARTSATMASASRDRVAGVWTRDGNRAYKMGRKIKAGRVWTNCYHAYPAGAAFGGYKISGIGRENHAMMLDHYSQTKNLLVSYSTKPLGFF